MVEIALYQPDIPQNTATILRTAACLDLTAHIIEPAGFRWSESAFRRAGMDYLDMARIVRHRSWVAFRESVTGCRIVLATTRADLPYTRLTYCRGDVLLFGRESAGVPDIVHDAADERIIVPIRSGTRSLNVAVACAMIAGEALRQLGEP